MMTLRPRLEKPPAPTGTSAECGVTALFYVLYQYTFLRYTLSDLCLVPQSYKRAYLQ